MKIYQTLLGCFAAALGTFPLAAQTPVLSNIESPYAAVQSPVTIAGGTYSPGAVAYGPVGTPLIISGKDFGPENGAVTFPGTTKGTTVQANVTSWSSTILFLTVPSGATSGLVQVTASGHASNGIPFVVTPGTYSGSCQQFPSNSQLQIVTVSLPNGTVGSNYSATLSAEGGTSPYTWSLSGGTLPAGLSLTSSGVFSGKPTTASGQVDVTVEVTDSKAQVVDAVLSIAIDAQTLTAANVYSYAATSYAKNGNLLSYQDSINGTWNFQYDGLNRLYSSQPGAGADGDYANQNLCTYYDSFGNRTVSLWQTAACPAPTGTLPSATAKYNANNQVTFTTVNSASNGFTYDAAGNVLNDGANTYVYDGEGRLCAVQTNPVSGGTAAFGYIYDAEGRRVAKGSITTGSPLTQSACNPATNGFQLTESYVLDQSGEQLSTLDHNSAWLRTNVYGAGQLVATYDSAGLHFHLTDPLGTRRLQTNAVGQPETDCQSLPFGDQQYCFPDVNAPATADDATPLHFTGKERDTESGLDNFGARYYSSNMGRFLSPDPIIMNDLRLLNPQRWNKYAYVINNPLTLTDPTGKDAAYVNFSGMASGFGHAGLLSIHPGSGSATYSRFGPEKAGQPAGAGEVQTDHELPSVQFGADGLPTPASYAALIQAVAQYEGVSPDTVGIDYFKTTDAETTNLDQYIQQRQDASDAHKAPNYCFVGSSCRDYALGGLVAGGAIDAWRTQFMSVVPNTLLQQLSGLADQYVPDATKATVTPSECDTLPDGTQRCQ